MTLGSTPQRYDPKFEAIRNRILEDADDRNLKRQADVEFVSGAKLILRSPNGARYQIVVSNAGALSATAI